MTRSHKSAWGLALAVAAVAPLLFAAGGGVLNAMVLAAAYTVMALGLNLIVGMAGLLDLGFVAFFAVGAYCAGYLASSFRGLHFDFLVIAAAGAASAGLIGIVLGVPTLRLRRDYVALVTLAFGEIIGQVATNGGDIGFFGGHLTSGPISLGPIDRIDLPGLAAFGGLDLRPWYWLALALVVLAVFVSLRLRDSRLGRAWTAIREDEEAAVVLGVPLVRTKLLAYGIGASFGGVAGVFLASYIGVVNSNQFAFSFSIFVLTMVILGGIGSIPGVIAGAALISVFNSYLLPDVLGGLPGRVGLDFDMSAVSSGVYGFLLVLVILVRPIGLLPARGEA